MKRILYKYAPVEGLTDGVEEVGAALGEREGDNVGSVLGTTVSNKQTNISR